MVDGASGNRVYSLKIPQGVCDRVSRKASCFNGRAKASLWLRGPDNKEMK